MNVAADACRFQTCVARRRWTATVRRFTHPSGYGKLALAYERLTTLKFTGDRRRLIERSRTAYSRNKLASFK